MQNLSKSAGIRELNVPHPGNVFIIGDLAQIEGRVAAWLAEEESQLAAFRDGRDLYLEFAGPVFGRFLSRADRHERSIGKAAVLGLNFGMGAGLFAERLRTDAPQGLALLQERYQTDDPETAAQWAVDQYRRAYPRIHANAVAMNDALRRLVADGFDQQTQVGRWIRMRRQAKDVVVELPTGGFLTYHSVGLAPRVGRFGPELCPTYLKRRISFSMPIENAVQAIARDIFARALLELERAGFEIAFHVHDEVIVEIKAKHAPKRLMLFKDILGANDERCPGLPIACDAFLADRYTKDEEYMREFTQSLLASA